MEFCLSGEEALDSVVKAYSHGLSYKLILTDFRMPFMDGIEATEKILSHLSNLGIDDLPEIYGLTGHV